MRALKLLILVFLLSSCGQNKKELIKNKDSYKIAYNVLYVDSTSNYEVFIMNMDGTDSHNITNLPGVEWTYYAYEDDIYFISDKDTSYRNYFLYKMKADGSEKIKISDIRLADSWHSSRKQGSELIVRPHSSIDTAFYIISNSGEILQRIKPALEYFNDPVFSPDGKQIVFRGGNKSIKYERGYDDELYIMNEDGSDLKRITYFPETDTFKLWHNYTAGPPRWHKTENFITYQSMQNGRYNLFAVRPDGSEQWKLTNNNFSEGWHDWSPDGNYLAIEVFDKAQSQFNIALMNWATKEVTILTDSTYKYQQAPVFVKISE